MATEDSFKIVTARGWPISRYIGSEIHARLPAAVADQMSSAYYYDSIKVMVHDDASLVDTDHNKEAVGEAKRVREAFLEATCVGMAEGELCHFIGKVVAVA